MADRTLLGRPHVAQVLVAVHRWGALTLLATVAPLASMFTMLVTVTTCLLIWRQGPAAAPGLIFPAISELGADPPTRHIYQVGFAICGALLSLSGLMFEELLAPHLLRRFPKLKPGANVCVRDLKSTPELNGSSGVCQAYDAASSRWTVCLKESLPEGPSSGGTLKSIKAQNLEVAGGLGVSSEELALWRNVLWWCHASSAGIILQGVFTLRRDLTPECFVHWGGAILFMAGAMQHGKSSNQLYQEALAADRCQPLLKTAAIQWSSWLRRIILDYASVIVFMLPLLMQVWPRVTGSNANPSGSSTESSRSEDQKQAIPVDTMNIMGLCQWGIIMQFAIYFLSYAFDMHAAASMYDSTLREDQGSTASSSKKSE